MSGPDGDALLRLSRRIVACIVGVETGEWRELKPRPRMESRGLVPGPRAFRVIQKERKVND